MIIEPRFFLSKTFILINYFSMKIVLFNLIITNFIILLNFMYTFVIVFVINLEVLIFTLHYIFNLFLSKSHKKIINLFIQIFIEIIKFKEIYSCFLDLFIIIKFANWINSFNFIINLKVKNFSY